jgi:hypothetical protein
MNTDMNYVINSPIVSSASEANEPAAKSPYT